MEAARRLLVAIDVDGTLVNTEVSDLLKAREIGALESVRSAGHVVALCTGRNLPSLTSLLERSGWFPADLPLVLLNGALVHAGEPRRQVVRGTLCGDRITTLVRLFRAHATVPMIYGTDEDGGFLYHETSPVNDVLGRYLASRRNHVGRLRVVPDLLDLSWEQAMEVGTIDETPRVRRLTRAIDAELGGAVRTINTQSLLGGGLYSWAEVFDAKSGKDHGVRVLSEIYDIPLSRTVAIGDNFNDLDMFAVAGSSVAMGNGPADVRSQADHVTTGVAAGGAAAVLDAIAAGEFPAPPGQETSP